jgi:redox-sensing transcriptional repressor
VRLRRLVLERLMRYYRLLSEWTAREPMQTVTSAQIGQALDIDPTQVRKDLRAIGVLGMGRVGFDVCEVCRAVRIACGFDQSYEAALVGVGHLGGALLAYGGFAKYGLHIVAAYDSSKRKVGRRIAGLVVRPISIMTAEIERRNIHLAILTTPVEVAQQLTNSLVLAGVVVIWNFTPAELVVPPGVLVRHEHISKGLSHIAYRLKNLPGLPESRGHRLRQRRLARARPNGQRLPHHHAATLTHESQ